MYQLEDLGLVKFDFLCLKTLTIIQNTQDMLRRNKKITIDMNFLQNKFYDLSSFDYDD